MYKLTPKVSKSITPLLKETGVIFDAINTYGSPLNILFPEEMGSNIDGFKHIFNKHDIDGKIFYAHKPNKSNVFATQAYKNSIGIDVASVQELKSALSSGFKADEIEVTGPKSKKLLLESLNAGITINIDSLNELKKIISLSQNYNNQINILLRISNFPQLPANNSLIDRFGIEFSKLNEALELIKGSQKISLVGISFHSNKSQNLNERVKVVEILLNLILKLQQTGFSNCTILNIGGGYPINYIESKSDWDKFILFLKESIKNQDRVSFNGSKYGFRFDGQAIKGTPSFKDFYVENSKEKFLDSILSKKLESLENRTIGQILSENFIELWIEPGKSLLDQCGITVSKVIENKRVKGENILVLEMNYTNLHANNNELISDPIVIKRKSKSFKNNDERYFAVGSLCSELDLITNHLFFSDKNIEQDDLIVFVNTAPYRMDFVESEPLQNPVAKKVVWHNSQLISEKDYILNKK